MTESVSGPDDAVTELHPIPIHDPIVGEVGRVVEPSEVDLTVLPSNLMDWQDFERLLLDLARDELALESLHFLGSQDRDPTSLDVLGTNPDGTWEALQAKRYSTFTVADLDDAVDRYARPSSPFRLARLIIAVDSTVDDAAVDEHVVTLNHTHRPMDIAIWDQQRISEMLRTKPDIVAKYFGALATQRFCVPNQHIPANNATPDAVTTANAVLLGPLTIADAQGQLAHAQSIAAQDPGTALTLFRDVQSRLIGAGFPGHAAEFDNTVAHLCVQTGDERAAIRLLMDGLWAAEVAGNSLRADKVARTLRELAGLPDFGPTDIAQARSTVLGAAFQIADFVTDHLHSPAPSSIDLPGEALARSDVSDRARTLLFAAERALADDDPAWITARRDQVESALAAVTDTHLDVAVRLRLVLAETTGDWAGLIGEAQPTTRGDLVALIHARHARYLLLRAAAAEADREWGEAIGAACLARRHEDAADWLYSQRFLANRFLGLVEDRWHPLAQALSDLPSRPRIVTTADRSRERALAALYQGELRVAAINLRRQLLDGVRSASFHDELDARRLLGQVYLDSENLPLAAYYTVASGDAKAARTVAKAFGDDYHDVSSAMNSPLSWVAASALVFATEQADLIPDTAIDTIAEHAFAAIDDTTTGSRVDSPILSPQMYLSGYGLLGALAQRLSPMHAERVLAMLADGVVIAEHHYRRTDDSHVRIAAGIAHARTGALRDAALDQLVGLYERGAHPFTAAARAALTENLDRVGLRLRAMADSGHRDAAALLEYSDPGQVAPDAARAAAQRLCQPSRNSASVMGTGTGAVNDSLLAAGLPTAERISCIEMLMANASSPWEGSSNRDDYLLATSNLIDDLDERRRRRLFDAALNFATAPPLSQADAMNASMRNPLSAMRINDFSDSRPTATLLAAKLAATPEEKRTVRDLALRLIGVGDDEDHRIATTLQRIKSELAESIGLLAQGSWPLRSVAAELWAELGETPQGLGLALSVDRDVRVRRALARALRTSVRDGVDDVAATLASDPRWSVRSIVERG